MKAGRESGTHLQIMDLILQSLGLSKDQFWRIHTRCGVRILRKQHAMRSTDGGSKGRGPAFSVRCLAGDEPDEGAGLNQVVGVANCWCQQQPSGNLQTGASVAGTATVETVAMVREISGLDSQSPEGADWDRPRLQSSHA